jgi:serine-type D-Ala-D-Ala carboxypeptidase/endopeptidase
MTRRFLTLLAFAAALGAADVTELRGLLKDRVDSGKSVGMVAGIVDANGREFASYGHLKAGEPAEVNAGTLFEVGSITKVFTSLVLADMVEGGEVKLDDPVSKYLPEGVSVPQRNGRPITLLDLSMQISGLPRVPDNLMPDDPLNPYAAYTPARLYAFLSRYTLPRDPGEKYEYSNLGAGLLGHVLERRAGIPFAELLHRRIFVPLGMKDTTIALTPELKARMATAHGATLMPMPWWEFDALAGCGAVRSSARDLLIFLAANLGLTKTPLDPALRRMRSVRHPTGIPNLAILMAWHEIASGSSVIVWHNGGTGGSRSFIGFDLAAGTAVVVLSNSSLSVDDIGIHALNASSPVQRFAKAAN